MKIRVIYLLIAAGLLMSEPGYSRETRKVAVLPFENIGGQLVSTADVMAAIRQAVIDKGYNVVDEKVVEGVLFQERIRRTGGLSKKNASLLKERLGVDYVVVGTFYLFYTEGTNPQFGLSARLLATGNGEIVWGDSVGMAGEDFTTILEFGTIKSFEKLASRVVGRLFAALPSAKASAKRHFFNSPVRIERALVISEDEEEAPLRLAVLPFDNRSERMGAAKIATDVFLTEIFKAGFDVVELGEVEEKIIAADIWVYGGMTDEGAQKLAQVLGVDAVIMGTVEKYDEGFTKTSPVPDIELYSKVVSVRMNDFNRLLAACHTERNGNDSKIVLDFGVIRSAVPLTRQAVDDVVNFMDSSVASWLPGWFTQTYCASAVAQSQKNPAAQVPGK